VNSLAAQEFASDYTDPYLVRSVAASADFPAVKEFNPRFTWSYEWQSPLGVNAQAVTGTFQPTVPVDDYHAMRYAFELNRAPALWVLGTELTVRAEVRATFPFQERLRAVADRDLRTFRGALVANLERPFGDYRLATATILAGVWAPDLDGARVPPAELVYMGGPVSAPGYGYHTLVTTGGFSEHVEFRIPAPFIPFSLGRFGRVPARGSFAPFAHVVGASDYTPIVCVPPASSVVSVVPLGETRFGCNDRTNGWYPSFGAAYITPFDLLRLQVARGVARGGRWTFNVDVSREFWGIM
jgi:hypothetical protein